MVFTASGNSELGADAYLGGPGSQADLLVINTVGGGSVTGQTGVYVNDVNSGPGSYNQQGIAVVDVTGATGTSVPGNWVLADNNGYIGSTPVINEGLFAYYLATDPEWHIGDARTGAAGRRLPTTGNPNERVALYSVPGYEGQELPIAVTGAQNLWEELSLLWEDRQSEIRDWAAQGGYAPIPTPGLPNRKGPPPVYVPTAPSFNVWAKGLGSWTDRTDQLTTYPVGGPITYNLNYKQNSYGVIGGFDYGHENVFAPGDALIVGPLGGYLESHLNFDHTGELVRL